MLFKRLGYQLFFAFFVLTLLTALALIGSVIIYNKKNKITKVIRDIDDIRVLALKNFKLMDDYLTYETKNENYFRTGNSSVKAEFEKNYYDILYQLQLKKEAFGSSYPEVLVIIDSIVINQKNYYKNFNDIEVLFLQKGYKDYGVEGRMREFAHQIMQVKNEELLSGVLMMRRHEKDYIIRGETSYFIKFNQAANNLINLSKRKLNNTSQSKFYSDLIINYKKYFKDYYNLQCEIGASEKEGILFLLNTNYRTIDALFNEEKEKASLIELDLQNTLKFYFIFFLLCSLAISLIFGYVYSNRISKRVIALKQIIDDYVMSGFRQRPVIQEKSRIMEFDLIGNNFLKMADEIDSYINFFKAKVDERTAEITLQKEEIETQKQQIQSQNDKLWNQQADLILQKQQLSEKNQNFCFKISIDLKSALYVMSTVDWVK